MSIAPWTWIVPSGISWLVLHWQFAKWGRNWTLSRIVQSGPLSVRICIPARDEAGRIGRATRSALETGSVEVVVVDDGSTDGTAAEALAAGAGDPRLTVLPAPKRPEGWAGKPWACNVAAGDARTEWLLFVDADVVLDRGVVAAAVLRAEADHVPLLSLFGTWELGSLAEHVGIPVIGWFIRGAVDLDRLNAGQGSGPLRAFANGQFILVHREEYEKIGGHGSVRADVLDDVKLANRFVDAGLRSRLLWAPWAFKVRLYRGIGEIVNGYRKNLYEGLGRRWWLALIVAWIVYWTACAPLFNAPILWMQGERAAAVGALVVLAMEIALRIRLDRRDGRTVAYAWTHPFGGLLLVIVLLLSMFRRSTWKGREFVAGKSKA